MSSLSGYNVNHIWRFTNGTRRFMTTFPTWWQGYKSSSNACTVLWPKYIYLLANKWTFDIFQVSLWFSKSGSKGPFETGRKSHLRISDEQCIWIGWKNIYIHERSRISTSHFCQIEIYTWVWSNIHKHISHIINSYTYIFFNRGRLKFLNAHMI